MILSYYVHLAHGESKNLNPRWNQTQDLAIQSLCRENLIGKNSNTFFISFQGRDTNFEHSDVLKWLGIFFARAIVRSYGWLVCCEREGEREMLTKNDNRSSQQGQEFKGCVYVCV